MKIIISILLLSLLATIILAAVFNFAPKDNSFPQPTSQRNTPNEQENVTIPETNEAQEQKVVSTVQAPLHNWQDRITKKPFGIFINPKTSPVQPEKFQGFHTGTDFEKFENEVDQLVNAKAICHGKIIQKKFVNGYGGVIVQDCEIENDPITVLYGHLDLEKSTSKIGDTAQQNQNIAVLAPDNSFYSDGERKHLHLGIHKGKQIQLQGYVQTKNQLMRWLDFEEIQDILN